MWSCDHCLGEVCGHVIIVWVLVSRSRVFEQLTFAGEDTEFLLRRQQGLEVWSLCGVGLWVWYL